MARAREALAFSSRIVFFRQRRLVAQVETTIFARFATPAGDNSVQIFKVNVFEHQSRTQLWRLARLPLRVLINYSFAVPTPSARLGTNASFDVSFQIKSATSMSALGQ